MTEYHGKLQPVAVTARETVSSVGVWEDVGRAFIETNRGKLWRRHADAVNRRLLEAWLPASIETSLKTDLFDEAIGAGQADFLNARSRQVFGVDVAQSVVDAAKRRHPRLDGAVADARALPFATASVDCVVSLSTLDHFTDRPDIDTSLAEFRRILKPSGVLAITLDNPANPVVALRAALPFDTLRRLGLMAYPCGPTLGPTALPSTLERHGFAVERRQSLLHCPRVAAIAGCGLAERFRSPWFGERLLSSMMTLENLSRWPFAYRTGYFVAALARPV